MLNTDFFKKAIFILKVGKLNPVTLPSNLWFHDFWDLRGFCPVKRAVQCACSPFTWGRAFSSTFLLFLGLPGGSDGKESAWNAGDPGSIPGSGVINPWRSEWSPTPVFLPEEFCEERSLVGYSPWGHKESDTTEWLSLHNMSVCFFLGQKCWAW